MPEDQITFDTSQYPDLSDALSHGGLDLAPLPKLRLTCLELAKNLVYDECTPERIVEAADCLLDYILCGQVDNPDKQAN